MSAVLDGELHQIGTDLVDYIVEHPHSLHLRHALGAALEEVIASLHSPLAARQTLPKPYLVAIGSVLMGIIFEMATKKADVDFNNAQYGPELTAASWRAPAE